MLTLGFQVQGQERLSLGFRRMSDSLTDKRPLFRALAEVHYEIENEEFQTGGRADKWADNTPKTTEYKVRKYGSFVFPMVATGATRASLTGKGRPHSVYREDENSVTMGTDLPYPKYHMGPYKGRPARKVINLVTSDLPRYQKAGARVYRREARAAGFRQSAIGDLL